MPQNISKLSLWGGITFLYLGWGSTYLAIHFLVEAVPALLAAGSRNFLAGIILFTWAFFVGGRNLPDLRTWKISAIVGILLLTMGNGGVSVALAWIPTGYAALIVAAVPVWIVLIQWLWQKQKPNKGTMIGLLIGIVGVGLLLNPDAFVVKDPTNVPWGMLSMLVATFCWSLGVVIAKKYSLVAPVAMLTSIQMLSGGLLLLIMSVLWGEDFASVHLTLTAVQAFFYLLIVGSLGGLTVFSWLSQRASPLLVGTYNYVNPLVAITLGWWLNNETVKPQLLFAAGLILTAVLAITRSQSNKPHDSSLQKT